MSTELVVALQDALVDVLGAVEVHDVRRLTGGASRETWSFDASSGDGVCHELVLRRDPSGRAGVAGAMTCEAASMRAAEAAGVAVPQVLAVAEAPTPWGGAGMIMRRVGGEALGRRILRDERFGVARPRLIGQCAQALAALHTIDPDTVVGLQHADPLDGLAATIDDAAVPVSTFDHALRWLRANQPAISHDSVVHGDFRLGNLMVDEDGLGSVLDWELVHRGDPVEDLGWLCVRAWRFGAEPPVAGLGTREELLSAYSSAGGATVDGQVLRWWEVYGTLRWGVICLVQTLVHLRREVRSVELAAIGRRVAETEWDLLLLIEPAAAATALRAAERHDGASAGAAEDLFGPPSAVELVEAVRDFLVDQAMPVTEGLTSFHARVAANVLGMVERELLAGSGPRSRRAASLARLGVGSESELAAEIRAGAFDDRGAELAAALAEAALDRVLVANPRYVGPPP